jgi:hypothetical protein
MALQLINTGSFANDTTGTPAQTAFQIINANFSQLFGVTPATFGPPATPPGGTPVTVIGATPAVLPALAVTGQVSISGTAPAGGSLLVSGGTVLGSPTGGNEGAGTLNATGLFVNGVAVSTSSAAGNSGYILCLPTSTPSIVSSVRITSPAITHNSTGNYTVTHNLGTTTYGVSATVLQSSGSVGVVTVFSPTSTQISFLALVGGSLSDAIGDVYLNFIY